MNRHATAVWNGTLKEGVGRLNTQSGAFVDVAYSHKGRFVDETGQSGTNPEELIAAAHAGCFAMQFSSMLTQNGTPPEKLETRSDITFAPAEGGGWEITESALSVVGTVPDIAPEKFLEIAEAAKQTCPVSKALRAIRITLDARLA